MDRSQEEALRAAAEKIAGFRRQWADTIRRLFEAELTELEAKEFDPARGRGRGPKWANGGGA